MNKSAYMHQFREDSDIDLTPLLDVVFILLIFFIVSASFIQENGLTVINQNKEQQVITENNPVIVTIKDTGSLWLGNTPVEISLLQHHLTRFRAENPESNVIIKADNKVKTNTVIQIMDQIRLAGLYDISMEILD